MKLHITGWVEPLTVTTGVPFPPRTMYAVKVDIDECTSPHGSHPAYFSRRVAERIAVDRVQVMAQTVRRMFADLAVSPGPHLNTQTPAHTPPAQGTPET